MNLILQKLNINRLNYIKFLVALLLIIGSQIYFLSYGSAVYADVVGGLEYLKRTGQAFAEIAKKVSPGVVHLQVEQDSSSNQPFGGGGELGPFSDDILRFFFGSPFYREGPGQQQVKISQGSGFIMSPDGYIITNNHVIKNASKITVGLQQAQNNKAKEKEYIAKIIGSDPKTDIAVIKIEPEKNEILPVLKLGNSDAMQVGEWVVAVGNPFGLSHTITAGIVSGIGRSGVGIADYENFIQTDAAINPGNSGGPLINLDGEVIGINTAIYSRTGGYMGVGFAIPSNMAKSITEQLIDQGSVTRGFIGITIQDLTKELANNFGLKHTKGILVSSVVVDSPASAAGIKQGDIILSYGKSQVESVVEFRNQVALTSPGTKVAVKIYRNGAEKILNISIGTQATEEVNTDLDNKATATSLLGISVQNVTQDIAKQLDLESTDGVLIIHVEPSSGAARAGIRRGMVITEVNRKVVHNVTEFNTAIKSAQNTVLLLIKQSRQFLYVTLPIESK